MKKCYALIGWLFWMTVATAQAIPAPDDDLIPGQLIVQLKPQVEVTDFIRSFRSGDRADIPFRHDRQLGRRFNMHVFAFNPEILDKDDLLDEVRRHPMVEGVQFNYVVKPRTTTPDDPGFSLQWTLERIGVPEVWDITTGGVTARGDTIVLAILDGGFDIDHEDLVNNVWINRFEIPDNNVDDDGNGYVDDVAGWNYYNNSPVHLPDPHGTSVAGVAGATGNNGTGVAGVNWNIRLMLLATDNVAAVIDAYLYVLEQRDRYNRTQGAEGAFVVATNASFGQEKKFCSEQPVWGGLYDMLGEVGILTGAGTANSGWDVDEVGDMPTTCTSNFIITTLNTTDDDRRFQGSAFGRISIDLGTPGNDSHTVKPGNDYGTFGGNSAAAPHLSGAIALLYSLPCTGLAEDALVRPAETALFIRQAILQSVDPVPALASETATGGRLNVFRAMEAIQESCGNTTGPLAFTRLFPNPVSLDLTINYEAPDFDPLPLQVYNMLGQLVYSDVIQPARFGPKEYSIDVSGWATGMYSFTLTRGKTVISRKVAVF